MNLDDSWDESWPYESVPQWLSPMAKANAEHDAAKTLVSLRKSKSQSTLPPNPQYTVPFVKKDDNRIEVPVWRIPIKVGWPN